jgi:membrane protease YdiL (CAAX protease family)
MMRRVRRAQGSILSDQKPKQDSPRKALLEVVLLFVGTCALIRGFLFVQQFSPTDWIRDNSQILVPLLFLGAPAAAARFTKRPLDLDILIPEPLGREVLKAAWFTLKVVLVIYPLFLVGNHLYLTWGMPAFGEWIGHTIRPHYPEHGLPKDLFQIVVWQLIAVGYGEEFFYRGYMQTRLNSAFGPSRFRFLGVSIGAPFWITAVLFTMGHSLVQFQWWQPAIFFPALVFGWLRERTGNILVPALFHAFANTAMITLDTIYGVRTA